MNESITPLIFEHEGSQIEISQEGVTLRGPSIRMNSGPANAGDKVFQVGDMQVALGASGVSRRCFPNQPSSSNCPSPR
jgi:hypothetical protein